MRVVICLRHNALMEQLRPESEYVVCFMCKEERHKPDWFPIRFAMINHKDGSMRRTWVWTLNWFAKATGGTWEREREDRK